MSKFEEILKSVILSENITNPKIHVLGSNEKGDGYLGIVTAVEVRGDNKILKIVVKTAPTSEKLRKQTPIRGAFLSEINFYEKVYPLFRRCQLERGDVAPFIKVAKCYGTSTKEYHEALIFENLKECGFKLYDRKITMTKEHVVLVLEEYGKLHAMSYVVRETDPNLFKQLLSNMPDNLLAILYTKDFKNLVDTIFTKIQNIPCLKHNTKIISALQVFHTNYISFFKNCNPSEADQYAIISHGDCWCNNMLFKYEDNNNPNIPTSMRLIDWQLQKLGSPVLDLSYFVYACADKNIFENLNQYLSIYHNSLTTQLRKLNCSETHLSFDNLLDQWKEYAKYGLLLAFIVIKLMLGDKDEVPDLSEAAESDITLNEAFDFEMKSEEEYQARVTDLIMHAYKIGVL